jgi:hypothetical protein
MQCFLIFNPLSLISPAVHNLAIVKHMMISLIVYRVISKKRFEGIITDIMVGVTIYVDPSLIYMMVPVRMVAEKLESKGSMVSIKSVKSLMTWGIVMAALLSIVDWQADIRNYLNILYVKDHSENIGVYWYIFVEIFK